jgi:ferredoxin
MSQQRVEINTTTCQGIGMCEGILPEVFEVGDDGKSHVDDEAAEQADKAKLQEAVENCPTNSIRLIADDNA